MTNFIFKAKNVNSKILFKEINDFITSHATLHWWHFEDQRELFLDVLEELFTDYMSQGTITQYKVVCDESNNPPDQHDITILVKYRQKHCLNITEITYIIK